MNIREYLEKQGVKYSHKGFTYLYTAIELAELPVEMMPLYAAVALKHGTAQSKVERNMRTAVKAVDKSLTVSEFVAKAVWYREQSDLL